jgi:hypothetical protein
MTADVFKHGPRAKRFVDQSGQLGEPLIEVIVERDPARVNKPALDGRTGRPSLGQRLVRKLVGEMLKREVAVALECEISATEYGVHRRKRSARFGIGRGKRNQLGKCCSKLHHHIFAHAAAVHGDRQDSAG